jgi:hypothetical protein
MCPLLQLLKPPVDYHWCQPLEATRTFFLLMLAPEYPVLIQRERIRICGMVEGYCCCVVDRHCFLLPAGLRYEMSVSLMLSVTISAYTLSSCGMTAPSVFIAPAMNAVMLKQK